jgi:hypothetical protein
MLSQTVFAGASAASASEMATGYLVEPKEVVLLGSACG